MAVFCDVMLDCLVDRFLCCTSLPQPHTHCHILQGFSTNIHSHENLTS